MFSIGEMSKRTGVKVPTIRYYETLGLLQVDARSEGNQRRYTANGLARLSFIRHARALGFSIADIRELTTLSEHPGTPCDDAHAIASRHLMDIRARIDQLQRLEVELARFAACDADKLTECPLLETLADHALCHTEH